MSHAVALRRMAQDYVIDLYLRPPVWHYRLMDYHLMDRIVKSSNQCASQNIDKLTNISKSLWCSFVGQPHEFNILFWFRIDLAATSHRHMSTHLSCSVVQSVQDHKHSRRRASARLSLPVFQNS